MNNKTKNETLLPHYFLIPQIKETTTSLKKSLTNNKQNNKPSLQTMTMQITRKRKQKQEKYFPLSVQKDQNKHKSLESPTTVPITVTQKQQNK